MTTSRTRARLGLLGALSLAAAAGYAVPAAGSSATVSTEYRAASDGSLNAASGSVFIGGVNKPGEKSSYSRYTVAQGVEKLLIRLRGGGGPGGVGEPAGGGGQGAYVEAVLSVHPGDVLEVRGGDAGHAAAGGSTVGRASVVRYPRTGNVVAAGGGGAGRRVQIPEVPGTCSIESGGAGGAFTTDATSGRNFLVIDARRGLKGGEACIGKAPGQYENGRGGGAGRAGAGGQGSATGSDGIAGFALVIPLG